MSLAKLTRRTAPISVTGSRLPAGAHRLATPLVAAALLLATAHSAQATVTFYTDEAAFTAAVDAAAIGSLDTTAANVALSDEVVSAPAQDEALGAQLTFDQANTGLCGSFTLQTIESGAGITFDDGEPSPSSFPADTLSIGDIDDFEDDDFRLTFPTGAFHAAGLFLVNNTQSGSESFKAFGSGGLIGTLPGVIIPDSSGYGSTFVGVVATEPLVSVRFNEDAAGDDIAIRGFRLGCAAEDPDGDGLSNLVEQRAGTDPNDSDTDDDGLLDGAELGTGSFGAQQVISTLAIQPRSVVAADLDGDGDTDLLSVSQFPAFDHKIAWYENTDGDGSFGALQVISTLADDPGAVFAADLDGDGDTDVLSASRNDDKIAWYENEDGTGGFGAQQVISTLADAARAVIAADVDGDGDLDVLSASGNGNDDKIAWYENIDGVGGFGAQQVISTLTDVAQNLFAADLDGDGDMDVLSASSNDDKIAWYENTDGVGGFGVQQVISTIVDSAVSVFAADVDGDGDRDVLSASLSDDKLAWYENTDGVGGFGAQQLISTLADLPWSVFAADVDGDGDTDVLSASSGDDKIAWYENIDGAGGFGAQQVISTLADAARVVIAADVDGDGDFDVFASSMNDSEIAWYEQTNVADPLDPDSDDDGMTDGFEVANGFDPLDADEDTDDDGMTNGFEVANGFDPLDADEDSNGTVDGQDDEDADGLGNAAEEMAGTDPNDSDTDDDGLLDGAELGTGSFGAQQVISTLAIQPRSVVAADLDGDGDTDLLSVSQFPAFDHKIAWYENTDGDGSFGALQVISTLADDPGAVFAADLDGDGDTDVLSASRNDDKIAWYENEDGTGGFGAQQVISTLADAARAVIAADVDGDGDLDVLSASGNGNDDKIAWYENIDGVGGFGAQQVISTLTDVAQNLFAADLDGDGDMDVLSASSNDDKIAWYENTDGVGGFGVQQVISTIVDSAVSVFAADVDGDGDRDVLSASLSDDKLAWYENTDGVGGFGAQQLISTLADLPWSVFAADVDGDGDTDVLSASSGDDKIAWYENIDGAGGFGAQQVISTLADAARVVIAADVDGDGDFDVFASSMNDSEIAWYEQTNVADPLDPDSDDDGSLDGAEIAAGTDPFDSDSDDDGLLDGDEAILSADPLDPDSDNDGVCDGGLAVGGTCTVGPDTCTLVSDPGQQNSDSLSAGDACQCGDVSNNGIVDATDLLYAQQHVVGATIGGTFVVTRCNLVGPEDAGVSDCNVADLAVLDRQVNGIPMSQANQAACDAWATP